MSFFQRFNSSISSFLTERPPFYVWAKDILRLVQTHLLVEELMLDQMYRLQLIHLQILMYPITFGLLEIQQRFIIKKMQQQIIQRKGIKMHTKSKKEYDLYWQAIRGLAILAVVLIHCKSNIQWPIISFGGGVLSSCQEFN